MAARKHLAHDQKTREKIRTSQLINRLEKSAFGEIELTPQQIKSIEILLKKALPDLASIQIAGDPDAPLRIDLSNLSDEAIKAIASAALPDEE